jgi:hypothetical protein
MAMRAVDGTGDLQPQVRDAHTAVAAYYIVAELIINMFLVELFVGVIAETYYRARERARGGLLLSPSQKQWVENMRIILVSAPPHVLRPPASKYATIRWIRRTVFTIVEHSWFDAFVVASILLNVAAISLQHYPQSMDWAAAQELLNSISLPCSALKLCCD